MCVSVCMHVYGCIASGGFRGARGAVASPPANSGHTKGWMCCYKNTLIRANSVIFVHFNA